jgi:hypothetical protein
MGVKSCSVETYKLLRSIQRWFFATQGLCVAEPANAMVGRDGSALAWTDGALGVPLDTSCASAAEVANMLIVAHNPKIAICGRASLLMVVNISDLLFGRPSRN